MFELSFDKKDIDRIEDFITSAEFTNNLLDNLEFHQSAFVLQKLLDAVDEAKECLNGTVH